MVTPEVKVERSSDLRAEQISEVSVEWSSDLEVGWNLEQWKCEMGHPLTTACRPGHSNYAANQKPVVPEEVCYAD